MADCTESVPEVRADDAARADIGGGAGERPRRAGEAASLGCSEDGGTCDREAGPDGGAAPTEEELAEAAKRIHEAFDVFVLAKGGVVLEGEDAVDVFYDGEQTVELRSPKIGQERVNGAGCTLAAAVTAELAKGATPLEAARTAKAVVTSSIENRQKGHTPFDSVYQGKYQG